MPLGDVTFDYDQFNIRDDQRGMLQKNADYMRRWTTVRVSVEGHADARGTNEYNLALGTRRATAVRDYMVGLGSVLQAKKEAQAQDCEKRILHAALSENGAFRSEYFVLRRAQVPDNTILFNLVDHDFVAKLIAAHEELHGFVDELVFLLEHLVVDLNDDSILLSLGVRVAELQPDIAHSLHLIFLGFLEVDVEKVALTFLPQGGQFPRVARDLIAESGFDVHKVPSAGGKVRAGRDALLQGIPPELVDEYTRLFVVRDNLAICAAEAKYCQGCYTQFTVNDLARLQGGKAIVRCSSCQRILYLPD